jgi:hypothetical protein
MASSDNRRRAADEAEGSRASARRREVKPLTIYLRSSFVLHDHPRFRLVQWNPSSAPTGQPLSGDSSESDRYSPVPYGELDALRFKVELEVAQCELEDVSKMAGIAELEWEDQRKQLLATIDGTALKPLFNPIRLLMLITIILHFTARDAELNQLKMLVEQLADKVNARGDTSGERLAAVERRMDEVATHGIRLGTTLGLAAMVTHTDVNYSTRLRGFRGGAPEDIEEIKIILESLDGHGDAIAELTHPQSVLNRLFD